MVEIFGQEIEFRLAHRLELILISLYLLFLFGFDVCQNKVVDFGINYRVTWFGNITSDAFTLALIFLILFHISLIALFVMNLGAGGFKGQAIDIIVGILATFGTAILLLGFYAQTHPDLAMKFFFIDIGNITFFHIGVAIEIIAIIYWSCTK